MGISEVSECPSCACKEKITDYAHGEILCKKCGLVLNEKLLDTGPEWRAFDDEQKSKRARTGGPVKFAKLHKGLTTEIDRYDRDIKGGPIPTQKKAQLYRLRKWQKRARMASSVDRNLSIALPELDRMCSVLNVPDSLKEEAAMLYRKAVSKKLMRGRSVESVVAASIYLVCRSGRMPKTLDELAEASGVKDKEVGKSYRHLCRKMGIRMPVVRAEDYIPRFSSTLCLSGETEAKAVEILQRAREIGVTSGRGPTGTAAAALYVAGKLTGDRRTQRWMSGKLGVTEVTIRNRAEQLVDALEIKFPD